MIVFFLWALSMFVPPLHKFSYCISSVYLWEEQLLNKHACGAEAHPGLRKLKLNILEEGMATHPSILSLENPTGSKRVRHD